MAGAVLAHASSNAQPVGIAPFKEAIQQLLSKPSYYSFIVVEHEVKEQKRFLAVGRQLILRTGPQIVQKTS